MSGRLVELLGLPGSGKTALARETCRALLQQGLVADVADGPISASTPRAARLLRRTSAATRAVLGSPRWALGSTARIVAVRQPSARDTASVLAQWLAVADLSARAGARGGVHLLEEGLHQTLWTLLLRSPDPLPPALLRDLPGSARSDTVVVLDVPLEVVEQRLRRRVSKHSRTQHLSPTSLRRELLRGQQLVEMLAGSTTTPVVRLSGNDDTTAAALGQRLADELVRRTAGLP